METEYATNLLVDLVEPVSLDMGRQGRRTVRSIALWGDDPARAAAVIRAAAGGAVAS